MQTQYGIYCKIYSIDSQFLAFRYYLREYESELPLIGTLPEICQTYGFGKKTTIKIPSRDLKVCQGVVKFDYDASNPSNPYIRILARNDYSKPSVYCAHIEKGKKEYIKCLREFTPMFYGPAGKFNEESRTITYPKFSLYFGEMKGKKTNFGIRVDLQITPVYQYFKSSRKVLQLQREALTKKLDDTLQQASKGPTKPVYLIVQRSLDSTDHLMPYLIPPFHLTTDHRHKETMQYGTIFAMFTEEELKEKPLVLHQLKLEQKVQKKNPLNQIDPSIEGIFEDYFYSGKHQIVLQIHANNSRTQFATIKENQGTITFERHKEGPKMNLHTVVYQDFNCLSPGKYPLRFGMQPVATDPIKFTDNNFIRFFARENVTFDIFKARLEDVCVRKKDISTQ